MITKGIIKPLCIQAEVDTIRPLVILSEVTWHTIFRNW